MSFSPVRRTLGRAVIALAALGSAACTTSTILVPGPPVSTVPRSIALGGRPYGVAVAGGVAYVTQLDGRSYTRLAMGDDPAVTGVVATGAIPTGERRHAGRCADRGRQPGRRERDAPTTG